MNPYLGDDGLEPFVAAGRVHGRGLYVLVRTSNPGSAALQELELAGGGQLWERVAALVDRLGGGADGPLASVGAVVGATQGHVIARARELMPRSPFLLPGIGAQGGDLAALAPAFAPGPGGGLVAASRSVLYADPGPRWQAAAAEEVARLRVASWSLAS